jgi:ABC-type sugar transport system permease subunit
MSDSTATSTSHTRSRKSFRTTGIITIVVGIVFAVVGVVAYVTVSQTLADQRIVVADDADFLAGDEVDGPFSAYAQAQVINKHALEATGGKTYSELEQDDPVRTTAMSASFLRASLFTSVVAFGVAFMAAAIGLVFILIGLALMSVAKAAVDVDAPRRTV